MPWEVSRTVRSPSQVGGSLSPSRWLARNPSNAGIGHGGAWGSHPCLSGSPTTGHVSRATIHAIPPAEKLPLSKLAGSLIHPFQEHRQQARREQSRGGSP